MASNFGVVFPDAFTSGSLHTVWSQLAMRESVHQSGKVFLDLSRIEFVDAEGVNYLALIPTLLEAYGKVSIRLPKSENVRRFLGSIGLIEYLERRFDIPESSRNDCQGTWTVMDGDVVRLLSRRANTFVFERGNAPAIFRQEILQSQMFAFSEILAHRCCGAIFELVSNVFDHSEQVTGCVTIQYRTVEADVRSKHARAGQLFIAVSDLGIGIHTSLRQRADEEVAREFAGLSDTECLVRALSPGVSRFGTLSRGNGLAAVSALASKIHVSSGRGEVLRDSRSGQTRTRLIDDLAGTSVLLILDAEQ